MLVEVRLSADQPLRVASNAAILRLVEKGTIKLGDPIVKHLPAESD